MTISDPPPWHDLRALADWMEREWPDEVGALQCAEELRQLAAVKDALARTREARKADGA